VRWLGYEDALARAAAEDKLVYIYFYSKSCPYCEMMEENTFPNASVSEVLNTRFIPVRVDVERRPDLASAYWVPGTPFHVFLCPNGSLLGVAAGYRNPDGFLRLLNTALAKAGERCADQAAAPAGRVPKNASEKGFEGAFSVVAAFALGLLTPLTPASYRCYQLSTLQLRGAGEGGWRCSRSASSQHTQRSERRRAACS